MNIIDIGGEEMKIEITPKELVDFILELPQPKKDGAEVETAPGILIGGKTTQTQLGTQYTGDSNAFAC